jgi:hypothetical protein
MAKVSDSEQPPAATRKGAALQPGGRQVRRTNWRWTVSLLRPKPMVVQGCISETTTEVAFKAQRLLIFGK